MLLGVNRMTFANGSSIFKKTFYCVQVGGVIVFVGSNVLSVNRKHNACNWACAVALVAPSINMPWPTEPPAVTAV